jgi:hypothetical protein
LEDTVDIDKGLKQIVGQDEEGVEVVIYQRSGDPYLAPDGSECTMTFVGSESKRYRDAERRQQRRLFKRARTRSVDITPEETEAEAVELAAAACIDWHGWELDGKTAPCEPDNVKAVLRYKHIFEQANAAIQGHAAIFAAKSSD